MGSASFGVIVESELHGWRDWVQFILPMHRCQALICVKRRPRVQRSARYALVPSMQGGRDHGVACSGVVDASVRWRTQRSLSSSTWEVGVERQASQNSTAFISGIGCRRLTFRQLALRLRRWKETAG